VLLVRNQVTTDVAGFIACDCAADRNSGRLRPGGSVVAVLDPPPGSSAAEGSLRTLAAPVPAHTLALAIRSMSAQHGGLKCIVACRTSLGISRH
jgi:hypothetical protein